MYSTNICKDVHDTETFEFLHWIKFNYTNKGQIITKNDDIRHTSFCFSDFSLNKQLHK